MPRPIRTAAMLLLLFTAEAGAASAQEKVDLATIEKIRVQAMDSSQVMDVLSWLTDVYGPRLAWSPNMHKAGDWAVQTMTSWGLSKAAKEPWVNGPAGLGWAIERFTIQSVAPNPFTIQAVPSAWSQGTRGLVSGSAMVLTAAEYPNMAALQKLKGKLRNVFIVQGIPRVVLPIMTAPGTRYTDEQLRAMMAPPVPQQPVTAVPPQPLPAANPLVVTDSALRFFEAEGVAALLLQGGSTSNGGTIFTSATARDTASPKVARITLGVESFGRIYRMLQRKQPVQIEAELKVKYYPELSNGFNVVAEIPGTDPVLKDQVVMIGGHFDSWHGGTGATDNAAGSAIMMEAMRILKRLNLRPRRTIRIGLWTGEELGLLGSANYVTNHYGTAAAPTAEAKNFQAYFNVDNGTGKIRGIYLQGNPQLSAIFGEWMKPFNEMGTFAVNPGNTSGTDHQSFDRIGLPGFQFVQDAIEYGTRTHHSNMDTYERVQEADMKYNAMILASFAWTAAQRDGLLPRKPAPAAPPGRGGRQSILDGR